MCELIHGSSTTNLLLYNDSLIHIINKPRESELDIIFLHGLKCECTIGVWEWEKQITQTLLLDLDLSTDISRSAASDQLEDTINYKAVAERVIEFAQTSKFQLIETLAEEIARIIREEFGIGWVRVKVNKGGAVKDVNNVGVIVERGEAT